MEEGDMHVAISNLCCLFTSVLPILDDIVTDNILMIWGY
jgi:hypothetical protein